VLSVKSASRAQSSKASAIRASDRLIGAIADIIAGLQQWRIWWVLSFNDIRQRYRRSTLGQFWLTLSTAVMIAGIGMVYSVLFKQPVPSYLPFLGVGLIVWSLLATLVNDLATCFISADTHLRSYPTPRSAIIYRTITRNLLICAHNLLIVPALWLLFDVPLTAATWLAIPGLFAIALNSLWIGMLIGPLCSRFRDLPQIIANAVQLAFFITPILFRPDQIQSRLWAVTHLNPFASFVEIVRAPLLGDVPALHHYLMVALCTIAGFAVAFPFFARFRSRIVYWL